MHGGSLRAGGMHSPKGKKPKQEEQLGSQRGRHTSRRCSEAGFTVLYMVVLAVA